MKRLNIFYFLASSLILSSCAYEEFGNLDVSSDGEMKISLAGEINQDYTTRANDDGFADGDVMGVYIVDYEGNNAGTLQSKGNRGDNVPHTFDEGNYKWNSAYDLYWKDKHTRIDVYGYYPFTTPEDVNDFRFTVKSNQAKTYDNGAMGDYEASDFLWGKITGVEPTTSIIRLPLSHIMANARVILTEGSGFDDGEWEKTDKQVLVTNTTHDCSIDLATGAVTPGDQLSKNSIIPVHSDDDWRAIVVPQTIGAGTTLFSITIDGIPYKFSKSEAFKYVSGKMSNFTIRVDKKGLSGQYTLTLINESITPWENDLVSHDAAAKEYIVIDAKPGKLKDAILEAKKDYSKIRNLKVTGEINSLDFLFMRDEMTNLQALNLKEVRIVKIENYDGSEYDHLPPAAFGNKLSLNRIILPDKLTVIGSNAFYNCSNLVGSLIIPEGVEKIENSAFQNCKALSGTLSLPTTLKRIGPSAFDHCAFNCELILPDNLELIDSHAFYFCSNLYGQLHLPSNLKELGKYCFSWCSRFSGDLKIPDGIKEIPNSAFSVSGFDGNLILHDGIISIGEESFSNCKFRGELILPKYLVTIPNYAFHNCNFTGTLKLPENIRHLGNQCFDNNNFSGIMEFPEGLLNIGNSAFAYCSFIEGLILPRSIETIGVSAFYECFYIGSINSRSEMPPFLQSRAFDGVPKDNFTLEVPESAVVSYQTSSGWRDFKRISAHHELVCRPGVACALSTEHVQTLVLNAESEWELDSMPEWCELSQTSGNKKTELTLTIKPFPQNSGSREGDIIFRLKDKDYTHSCHVSQYGYEHEEDEYLTLQKASKGNNGGINIVILGDGYDAKDISDGSYLKDMKEEIEYFFDIEPYRTYRDYFNVYTAFPLSTESGVGTINTIKYTKFNTSYSIGVNLICDNEDVFSYALNAPTVNIDNLDQTLIILVPNSTRYGGVTKMWESGAAIAICPKSSYEYPFDSRGIIQHEAGGHGFGKLIDEYIYINDFIPESAKNSIIRGKYLGWYDNIEITGKMHEVGWSHLIFDPRYSHIVDIFEGGAEYSRGVFRSEQNSCMNNGIPYFSTISRESIVKRIKKYSGEKFDFEDFVSKDNLHASVATRGMDSYVPNTSQHGHAPVIYKGSPLSSLKKKIAKNNRK